MKRISATTSDAEMRRNRVGPPGWGGGLQSASLQLLIDAPRHRFVVAPCILQSDAPNAPRSRY